MELKKLFAFLVLLSLSFFTHSKSWAATTGTEEEKTKEGDQNNTEISNYVHEALSSFDNLFREVDKESEKYLIPSLLKMYKDGIAISTKKDRIPVYLVVGPAGSGEEHLYFCPSR